jgi:hypothetical protein
MASSPEIVGTAETDCLLATQDNVASCGGDDLGSQNCAGSQNQTVTSGDNLCAAPGSSPVSQESAGSKASGRGKNDSIISRGSNVSRGSNIVGSIASSCFSSALGEIRNTYGGNISYWEAVYSIVTTAIGAGIVILPHVFSAIGMGLSILLLAFCTLVSIECGKAMADAVELAEDINPEPKKIESQSDVCRIAWGENAGHWYSRL